MLEKAMLFLDYECHQNGIEIPWDKIVKRMQPGSSGASLTQHLEKTRFRLVAEGHIVPPDKLKPELVMGDWVRALVRADPKGDPGKVRLVTWDEDVKHRHTNLETPGITTGSGKYRRGPNGRKSLAGSHRNEPRLKLEYPAVYDKTLNERLAKVADDKTKARRERAKQKRVEQRRIQRLEWDERAKANEDAGDPDAEFKDELESPKQPTRRSTRKSAGQKKKDTSDTESPMMQFSSISSVTPREMSTLPVKLSLSPEKLSNFPAGQSGSRSGEDLGADYVEDKNIENNIADKENIENGNADKENLEDGNTEEVVTAPELEHSGSSPAPVNEHNAHEGVGNETMEVDDEMIDVRESVEPDINYQGHSPLPTWYSVVEPAARRVSNDFGINPDPEDDVFGRLNSSPPTMSTWNGYGDMTNNSVSSIFAENFDVDH
ncbi:hypothetical protein N431DRAFT_339150 [Stipitochalara longipes BDJ]|nr:hypothetical protein N431DRAFT_339150 [Stipitochalara longipes BDJ]